MRLLPAEKVIAAIVLALAAIDLVCLMVRPIEVDIAGYGGVILVGLLLLATVQHYRQWRGEEKIAVATTGAALFTLFTIVGSIFNYMLLPVPAARVDATLAAIDSALGVHWPTIVNAVFERPCSTRFWPSSTFRRFRNSWSLFWSWDFPVITGSSISSL